MFYCSSVLLGILLTGAMGYTTAPVVINEVMANPRGKDSGANSPGDRNEFIELLNISAVTQDVSGWLITDGDAVDRIRVWDDSTGPLVDQDAVIGTTVLFPGTFALILDPEYADTADTFYQPYDIPPGTVVLTVGNTTLGDGLSTRDFIGLLRVHESETLWIDTYGTPDDTTDANPRDPGDGISMERAFSLLPDSEDNWLPSLSPQGSSPGGPNSVSPTQDLYMTPEDMVFDPVFPQPGDSVSIHITLHNVGRTTHYHTQINLFCDHDWDAEMDSGESLARLSVDGPIEPLGGSVTCAWSWYTHAEEDVRICAAVDSTSHALACRMLRVGNPIGHLIINEILYRPTTSGEWVELLNRSDHPINIVSWNIGRPDTGAYCRIVDSSMVLTPGSYALICSHAASVLDTYGPLAAPLLEPHDKLLPLRDQRDTVVLRDRWGFAHDMVAYERSWGGDRQISLERISSEVPSNCKDNWSSSLDPRGATPGESNSIAARQTPATGILTVAPNPFSPDGDGNEERTVISVRLPTLRAQAKISIYDRFGREVDRFPHLDIAGGAADIVWDGRDNEENQLPMGIYIVRLEAFPQDTGDIINTKTIIVLARQLQ